MSATIALDLFRPPILDGFDDAPRFHHDAVAHAGGGPSLDDVVVGAWEGLSAHRTVACPACGGAMAPRYGAGPAPVGGRCRRCATTLS